METPDDVVRNQAAWTEYAPGYEAAGRRLWASGEPLWGNWGLPESAVGLLPDVEGRDTLELGCGTGYVSAWLARRGARAVGLDPTWAQLVDAQQFQQEFGLHFPLVRGIAGRFPSRTRRSIS